MRNLNILQSGGGIYYASTANPFSNAAIADLTASAASSKSSDKDDGLIPKALMEKLSEKGIPTDVNKFMDMLADFEHKSSFGMGVNKRQLYKLLAYANQIIKLSEYLDAAEKRAIENGALDEVAVDDRGYLFVQDDKGQLKKVHASLFDASDMVALTNNELLQHRKFNPNEVDNSSIATTVGNNIGIEKINDYIQGIIKAVGTAETSSEAYTNLSSILGKSAGSKRLNQLLLDAFRDLYLLSLQLGPDAIFKVKDQLKSKNMEAAMGYIMSVLPNNMRTQLVARNVAAGGKYENSSKYAADIIGMAALAGNDTKMAQGLDYESSINKAAGNGAESQQHYNLTGLELLVLGSLGKKLLTLINNENPMLTFTLYGNGTGKLTDAENKLVNESILSEAMDRGLGTVVDQNNLFFGTQKITPHQLNKIIYDGQDVVNIWAPIDPVTGGVDFNKLKQYTEIQEKIKANPYLTDSDIKLLLSQIGLNGTIDRNGNFVGTDPNMGLFIVLTGVTSDEVVKEDPYSSKLIKSDKDDTFRRIKQLYAEKNKGRKGDSQYEFPQGWWEWSTNLFAAPIFMKVNSTAKYDVGAITGHGARVLGQSYENLLLKDLTSPVYKNSSGLL